jgi:hypothetical protein
MRLFWLILFSVSYADAGIFQHSITNIGGRYLNLLRYSGEINSESVQSLKYRIRDSVKENLDTIITLDSPGGYIVDGEILIDLIEKFSEQQNSRGMRVIGYVDRYCASMCISLFYGFKDRYSNPQAKFGFHSAADGNGISPEGTFRYLDLMIVKATQRKNFLTAEWLSGQLFNVFSTTTLTWYTAAELAEQNSGLIMNRHLAVNGISAEAQPAISEEKPPRCRVKDSYGIGYHDFWDSPNSYGRPQYVTVIDGGELEFAFFPDKKTRNVIAMKVISNPKPPLGSLNVAKPGQIIYTYGNLLNDSGCKLKILPNI